MLPMVAGSVIRFGRRGGLSSNVRIWPTSAAAPGADQLALCRRPPERTANFLVLFSLGEGAISEGDLAMCYEETFLQRWARKRAQRREKSEAVVERAAPKQPSRPEPVPTGTAGSAKAKETERDLEVV